jgi:exopolyphosphatase/guanosine-5'-triphosphate,3'-diphosphate pyrophosphatase
VIDVGTNSIRLIVGEVGPDLSYRVIDDEKVQARLGQGVDERGALALDAMSRSVETIERLKGIAEGHGLKGLRAVATSAVRDASNREQMLTMVRMRSGIELEVLSGEDEARYAHASVGAAFDLRGVAAGVLDIGGGSTELIVSVHGVIEEVLSLPLGAIRLTEWFGRCDDAEGAQMREMRQHLREFVREHVPKPPVPLDVLFGSGGAMRSLAGVSMHRLASPVAGEMLPRIVRGYEMTLSEVQSNLHRLDGMSVRDRASIPGLSPERADIIAAGVAIAERFMKRLGVDRVRAHDRGIRDGVIREMIRSLAPGRRTPSHAGRVKTARQFAHSCRFDEAHAEQVVKLSLSMFDQMAKAAVDGEDWASAESRELLHVAGLLHDVGYLIGHAKHHKHSYHLIVHSELDGFSHRQLEMVANLARYHRGSMPKMRHAGYARLSKEDRKIVRRLGAILRIAVGLDRTHTQSVTRVGLHVTQDRVTFELTSLEDPSVNIWEAERKSDLLEREFGFDVREWTHVGGAPRARESEKIAASVASERSA